MTPETDPVTQLVKKMREWRAGWAPANFGAIHRDELLALLDAVPSLAQRQVLAGIDRGDVVVLPRETREIIQKMQARIEALEQKLLDRQAERAD